MKMMKDQDLELGLFIFAGTDIYNTEIFEIIKPKSKCNKFSYKCLNKFLVDDVYEFLKVYNGSITFVDGNTFYIYIYGSQGFELIKSKKVDIGTRHNKGGQSQHRHERNYDIIKDLYLNTVTEETMKLNTDNNWIFGSQDIVNKIVSKNQKLQNGGFVEFDKYTINDTQKWLSYLKDDHKIIQQEDLKLAQILLLLQTDPDRLDFDPSNKDTVEWYMTTEMNTDQNNTLRTIYLNPRHKYYQQLFQLPYIGIKYHSFQDY